MSAIGTIQEAAGQTRLLDGIRAAVLDSGRLVVVAEVGAGGAHGPAVVGWGKTHQHPRPDGVAPAGHYLGGVTVDPAWRRRGIATALTAARMAWVADRADRVHYVVNAANAASVALHERWGFHEVARAAAFHGVTFAGGDGLLMAADVGPPGTRRRTGR
nr:GNAT family N-acetyltransferase [Isoptericola halotolerans]